MPKRKRTPLKGTIKVSDLDSDPNVGAMPATYYVEDAKSKLKHTTEEPKNAPWPFKNLPDKDFYRADEVEKQFNLSKGAAYGLIRAGHCDATRIGGHIRVPRSEMLRMAGFSTFTD